MSRYFAPPLAMTLCVVLALIVLLGLGTWQVQRLFWKQDLITRYQHNRQSPASPWTEFIAESGGDHASENEFRLLGLRGRFLHEHEMYLNGRSRIGEPGLRVLTPFRLKDGTTLLIDRGWIEVDYRNPTTRADGLFPEEVSLVGLFRLAPRPGGIYALILPENDTVRNIWYTLDLPMMRNHTGLEFSTDYYLMDAREGAPMPYGRQWQPRLHNSHLEYTITWYALALALLGVYIAFGIKRAREQR